jgi:hypothetical protein
MKSSTGRDCLCLVLAGGILLTHLFYGSYSLVFDFSPPKAEFTHFFVIGDWGVANDADSRMAGQVKVAQAMQAHANANDPPSFVLSVGDQAYPSGVSSVEDAQKRFKAGFTDIYEKGLIENVPVSISIFVMLHKIDQYT